MVESVTVVSRPSKRMAVINRTGWFHKISHWQFLKLHNCLFFNVLQQKNHGDLTVSGKKTGYNADITLYVALLAVGVFWCLHLKAAMSRSMFRLLTLSEEHNACLCHQPRFTKQTLLDAITPKVVKFCTSLDGSTIHCKKCRGKHCRPYEDQSDQRSSNNHCDFCRNQ